MLKRITIFCASSRMVSQKYFEAARQLARVLTDNEITAVYGGGAVGLMGAMADCMLENGGNIEGVIPQFMMKVEWEHPGVKNMIITKGMHERKKRLIDNVAICRNKVQNNSKLVGVMVQIRSDPSDFFSIDRQTGLTSP